jgi:hypothetical protein
MGTRPREQALALAVDRLRGRSTSTGDSVGQDFRSWSQRSINISSEVKHEWHMTDDLQEDAEIEGSFASGKFASIDPSQQ